MTERYQYCIEDVRFSDGVVFYSADVWDMQTGKLMMCSSPVADVQEAHQFGRDACFAANLTNLEEQWTRDSGSTGPSTKGSASC